MNAVDTRQDATPSRDPTATTWNEYLHALDEMRQHHAVKASRAQRALDEAIEQGRKLRNAARILRTPTTDKPA